MMGHQTQLLVSMGKFNHVARQSQPRRRSLQVCSRGRGRISSSNHAASPLLFTVLLLFLSCSVGAWGFMVKVPTATTTRETIHTPQHPWSSLPRQGGPVPYSHRIFASSSSRLYLWKKIGRLFRRGNDNSNNDNENQTKQEVANTSSSKKESKSSSKPKASTTPFSGGSNAEHVSVCIVGGGVSGLAAGVTCCTQQEQGKVVLLEASSTVGGRVQSDVDVNSEDGGTYTLDRGFAVFIEEYPQAQTFLNYTDLQLGQFVPGALVKLSSSNNDNDSTILARVADPLRQPAELWTALTAPVGTIWDKLNILRLVWTVRTQSIEDIFSSTKQQPETSTMESLTQQWQFSNDMITKFFQPFLEGIYLAPLEEQSSHMFLFVFKMFSEGAASLPRGGIGQVAQQLQRQAEQAGVDIRFEQTVQSITPATLTSSDDDDNDKASTSKSVWRLETNTGTVLTADSVILATEAPVTHRLVSQLDGFESLENLPQQVQRSVGNLYYSFPGPPPVTDPILILNGDKSSGDNGPVNNVCFPSSVTTGYAPDGYSLCSVTVLKDAMDQYYKSNNDNGKNDDRNNLELDESKLDLDVRKHLATWFPSQQEAILNSWKLRAIYQIPNAQPGQFKGPFPANVHGGRPPNSYRNKELPAGVLVCGDHMATATLNGALESGKNAGLSAAAIVAKASK